MRSHREQPPPPPLWGKSPTKGFGFNLRLLEVVHSQITCCCCCCQQCFPPPVISFSCCLSRPTARSHGPRLLEWCGVFIFICSIIFQHTRKHEISRKKRNSDELGYGFTPPVYFTSIYVAVLSFQFDFICVLFVFVVPFAPFPFYVPVLLLCLIFPPHLSRICLVSPSLFLVFFQADQLLPCSLVSPTHYPHLHLIPSLV